MMRFVLEGLAAGTFVYVACVEMLSAELGHSHGGHSHHDRMFFFFFFIFLDLCSQMFFTGHVYKLFSLWVFLFLDDDHHGGHSHSHTRRFAGIEKAVAVIAGVAIFWWMQVLIGKHH